MGPTYTTGSKNNKKKQETQLKDEQTLMLTSVQSKKNMTPVTALLQRYWVTFSDQIKDVVKTVLIHGFCHKRFTEIRFKKLKS